MGRTDALFFDKFGGLASFFCFFVFCFGGGAFFGGDLAAVLSSRGGGYIVDVEGVWVWVGYHELW